MRATIIYTLQRAVLFVAPFAILAIAQVPWYLSLVVALIFAFCASYVFLRGSRDAAIAELERARARRQRSDEDVEDEARRDGVEQDLTDGGTEHHGGGATSVAQVELTGNSLAERGSTTEADAADNEAQDSTRDHGADSRPTA